MEVPPSPENPVKLDKGFARLWMRLVLLFIIVAVIGLLITGVHYLLSINGGESGDLKPNPERTEREISQLRAEIQRLTTLLHNITKDARCQLCPKRWHLFMGRCYFISAGLEDERTWAESVEYCVKHNASLAVIHKEVEKEFILNQLSRFSETPFLWLGLTDAQAEGVWVWQDGTLLQNHRFLKVQWDSEHRDCADLRGDGNVFACDCSSYGPWLCEKHMEPQNYWHP